MRRLIGDRRERRRAGAFVVEGPQSVGEALAAGLACDEQFVPADRPQTAVAGAGPTRLLGPGVFEKVAPTQQPQPPIVIVRQPAWDISAVLAGASLVLVLDRIADPGNLGTIIRSAEAAGADAVVVTAGSVDPSNPKVVRSTAGSLFRLPVLEAALPDVAAAGLMLWGTTSHDDDAPTAYDRADLSGRVALVLGTEAHGLPADANGAIDRWLTIPHGGSAESLNVAMAATVLAFEVQRQRRAM
ncbi:MAG: RNA methyltransferase [Actinomycetota bacterium]